MSASAAPSTSAGSPANPIGVLAIGHSALTGESSDPTQPGRPAYQNSWATGTAPAVHSIYQRLVAVRPETKGHVANYAEGGAVAAVLPSQAKVGLAEVPAPQLVIIQTIDNDIRCDGTDAAHLPEFGKSVAGALKIITDQSPKSVILIVGQPGRPADDLDAISKIPEAKAGLTGSGPCDAFNPAGKRVDAHVATLTAIIKSYESEQARVCATVPQCHTDGGAFAAFHGWFADAIVGDWNHLTVHGMARIADTAWPIVQRLLR